MAELWKGAPVAAALTERLCGQAERLRARGISPHPGHRPGGRAGGGSLLRAWGLQAL